MGCVIFEGNYLTLFTALKILQETSYPVYVTAYKICHFIGLCAISGMGCVIFEGNYLTLFTALKILQETSYPVYVTAYKICHFIGLKKPNAMVFYQNSD